MDDDGFVTFADTDPKQIISKAKMDKLLQDSQMHAARLIDMDREVLRSKEFLSKVRRFLDRSAGLSLIIAFKALKVRDDTYLGADEEMYAGMADGRGMRGMSGMEWAEENLFE